MTDGPNTKSREAPKEEVPAGEASAGAGQATRVPPPRRSLLPLPGLAAICLYMFVLAATFVIGVAGGHIGPVYLLFAAFFITGGLGLLLLLRWAWALTLGAVVLLAGMYFWRFSTDHAIAFIAQGLLNLVFFLYLVRGEVREKLR